MKLRGIGAYGTDGVQDKEYKRKQHMGHFRSMKRNVIEVHRMIRRVWNSVHTLVERNRSCGEEGSAATHEEASMRPGGCLGRI